MTDPFRLDGRTVIVTGASRGIGAEVARAVVAQGGGVVLVARSEGALDDLAGSLGGPARTVAGDATAYTYLPASSAAFLEPEDLAAALRVAGFSGVATRRLALGTVVLVSAEWR